MGVALLLLTIHQLADFGESGLKLFQLRWSEFRSGWWLPPCASFALAKARHGRRAPPSYHPPACRFWRIGPQAFSTALERVPIWMVASALCVFRSSESTTWASRSSFLPSTSLPILANRASSFFNCAGASSDLDGGFRLVRLSL